MGRGNTFILGSKSQRSPLLKPPFNKFRVTCGITARCRLNYETWTLFKSHSSRLHSWTRTSQMSSLEAHSTRIHWTFGAKGSSRLRGLARLPEELTFMSARFTGLCRVVYFDDSAICYELPVLWMMSFVSGGRIV